LRLRAVEIGWGGADVGIALTLLMIWTIVLISYLLRSLVWQGRNRGMTNLVVSVDQDLVEDKAMDP
jgi:hypothetical protein